MVKNIYTILIFSLMSILFADPPDWEDNPGAYEFTATIVGGIVLDDNGEQMGECNEISPENGLCLDDIQDLFAAFDSEGNVRGIAMMLFPPFGPNQGTPVYEMQMRSNSEGDIISFKYYDASEDIVLDVVETYEFIINDILGDVINPIYFNIGASTPSCEDEDSLVAPFTCATAVATFGCDMLWGGITIGEACPESCGTCPEEDACGVCEGDGSSCTDCAGTPNGDAS